MTSCVESPCRGSSASGRRRRPCRCRPGPQPPPRPQHRRTRGARPCRLRAMAALRFAVLLCSRLRSRTIARAWRRHLPFVASRLPVAPRSCGACASLLGSTAEHTGTLVVNAGAVVAVTRVPGSTRRFPIRRMRPIDAYGGARRSRRPTARRLRRRYASRAGKGDRRMRTASIDISRSSPYLLNGRVHPRAPGRVTRPSRVRRGMAVRGGLLVGAFASAGAGRPLDKLARLPALLRDRRLGLLGGAERPACIAASSGEPPEEQAEEEVPPVACARRLAGSRAAAAGPGSPSGVEPVPTGSVGERGVLGRPCTASRRGSAEAPGARRGGRSRPLRVDREPGGLQRARRDRFQSTMSGVVTG